MWGWRNLLITSDTNIRLLNGNLHVVKNDGSISFPIEDVDVIIIESINGSISFPLLRKLANKGISLLICDNSFMPSGIFLPYFQSSNLSSLIFNQMELSLPFKKRIWKKIVQQKIINASQTLKLLNKNNYKMLRDIASEVKSGDTTNREAYAAKIYFRSLHAEFRRVEKSSINHALNYGYAIIRSAVARSLASTGLVCALGVGHKSKTNPFNLADDFVEVFRPFVDLLVFSNPPEGKELDTEYKKHLIKVLKMECLISNKVYTVSTASWEIAQSYARAVRAKNPSLLNLPYLDSFSIRQGDLQ